MSEKNCEGRESYVIGGERRTPTEFAWKKKKKRTQPKPPMEKKVFHESTEEKSSFLGGEGYVL